MVGLLIEIASCSSSTREKEYLLPPMLVEHLDKKTLVLDLDETLIHAVASRVPDKYDHLLLIPGVSKCFYVIKRPGVDEFLEAAAELFEVVVFTAGKQNYADAVLDLLDVNGSIITHRLYRHHCYQSVARKWGKVNKHKDLALLGRELSRTIIVDNNPKYYALHPDNAIPISSFINYDPQDCELQRVMAILRYVAPLNVDVREALAKFKSHE